MTHTTLNALDDQRGRPNKRLKHCQLTFNTGIKRIRPLIPPQILYEDLPLTDELAKIVDKGRKEAENIVSVGQSKLYNK